MQYTMGDGLEAMRRDGGGGGMASGDSSFYHYNHLGTTVALTNAAESVSDTYRHDAWGVQLASTGSTINPHTYVGQQRYYRMPNADLYHLGFRDYSQRAGRFTTTNPIRDGTNWFGFVGNAPMVLDDPCGLQGEGRERHPWYWWLWPPHWWAPAPPRQGPGFPEHPTLPPWVPQPQAPPADLCDTRIFCVIGYVKARGVVQELAGKPADEWTNDDVRLCNEARDTIKGCTNVDVGPPPIGRVHRRPQ